MKKVYKTSKKDREYHQKKSAEWREKNLEHAREWARNYQNKKQRTSAVYRKKKLENTRKWQRSHREQYNANARKYYRKKRGLSVDNFVK